MADVVVPTFKKRTNKATNIRKRPATPPPDNSASESEYTDDEEGVRVKRRKKDGVRVVESGLQTAQDLSKSTKFEADRSSKIAANEDATKTSNWYDEAEDAVVKLPSKAQSDAQVSNGGGYKGSANYSTFIEKNPNAPNRQVGPVKAPTNIRTITVTDFAPDVCKDYKQTGFCGFGDSCKFLHAREDYKQGWQLDKEWEKAGKTPRNSTSTKEGQEDMDDEEKMLESIPFACIICKGPYKTPVVTKCGHYFCERCAMTRYMKEKKKTCANCGADTNGTFNVARKLNELLDKKRKRAEERKQKARGAGEDISSEDGDPD
jgi:RING finger protein 113A